MLAKVFINRFTAPLIERLAFRWSSAWRDALASAIAAALAWILATHLLGHVHPVFAAISAVVCLAPGLPSHGKQAVGLMVGVATGSWWEKRPCGYRTPTPCCVLALPHSRP